MEFTIEPWMIEEAQQYAVLSARHTSNRHDFHRGGIDGKAENMFVGKLGEKVFKAWLRQQGLPFDEDPTSHEEADQYDFRVVGRTIDVKTFTKDNHRLLLEMVEQYERNPKDYYVAVRLRYGPFTVGVNNGVPVFDFNNIVQRTATILGWADKAEVGQAPIGTNRYLRNYQLRLDNLRSVDSLAQELHEIVSAAVAPRPLSTGRRIR